MNKEDKTPDSQLRDRVRTSLTEYQEGTLSLRRLIDDLGIVWSNAAPSEWADELRGHWWTLEQVYAVALDRGELTAMPEDAQADIDNAVAEIDGLLGQYN